MIFQSVIPKLYFDKVSTYQQKRVQVAYKRHQFLCCSMLHCKLYPTLHLNKSPHDLLDNWLHLLVSLLSQCNLMIQVIFDTKFNNNNDYYIKISGINFECVFVDKNI